MYRVTCLPMTKPAEPQRSGGLLRVQTTARRLADARFGGEPGAVTRATTREAAVTELAGAILGIVVMAAAWAYAYYRYGWAN